MLIRKAKKNDSKEIAPLLLIAMEDIVYTFINEENREKSLAFLEYFIAQKSNQYSYENIWVLEMHGQIAGAINVYDGGMLNELRRPIIQYLKEKYQNEISPEDETEAGEWYLDTLGVNPDFQGKGIGSTLIKYVIENISSENNKAVGLLVDIDNPHAKRLYERLGFQKLGDKLLVGKVLEHMQVRIG
ncbi:MULTISPECIES: GNAT family N-acetyltransferase [Weeksella]|uniref:GCN5-related N-acetyltransferase n=1 Tax=Weeksella virosa (strain ATCC 43766 / DSM 16922 / JCM 21250 / CCUG 30538 / CDC 9751 / IAM 14551 / NBRC 16016 / NCTC 11634 / CL345/78) TaxID=865938 RepID=F0NXC4_WEEVC|nr:MULTISPECIES: GNAT family N-acetyltransferase [Weeksella]ADX66898.1 GCN5-related N-acetyltransferase [Weeksella virosa DSM 16922]MDK7375874.1 GNAT family N-acetyltransferase [Weeksella virosa]MDK7674885.1 GNAT family N-acetyltransferase [Weeksella virosa]OFM82239.1 GCN5 family acetyltransferase [Weeksella sp. HMSC059D05]SUP53208.1 Spermine/spermidine acetyltransferase [Weeksella virosa]